MGEPTAPEPAVLFCGLLAGDAAMFDVAREALTPAFGVIESVSEVWPFGDTHYYEDELGPNVMRQFVSFREPLDVGLLAEVKRATNRIEKEMAAEASRPAGRRCVNIDPGYISLGSLVLATTKPRAHRVYLDGGIYAEVTLLFEAGTWRELPWTYPDYAAPRYHAYFTSLREALKARRRRA